MANTSQGGKAKRLLDRRDAMKQIVKDRADALLVTGLGSATYDAANAGDTDLNFYLWGAMGGTAALGLGLAIAQPDRRVLVVTGDGDMLMGLGSLGTVGVVAASNLCIVVFDNERYGETGAQLTHTHYGLDIAGMAAAAGFGTTLTVVTKAELKRALPIIHREPGPVLVCVKVDPKPAPLVLPERQGPVLKDRFRGALGVV